MADDRFGLAVPQAERCLADSVADDLGLADSHPDDWVAVLSGAFRFASGRFGSG